MTEKNEIESTHPIYDEMMKHWEASTLLMGGTINMREYCKKTLPRNQHESKHNYDNRVNASVLLNVYKETLTDMSKKPFQERVKWSDELPPKLKFIENNIDGKDNSQDVFLEMQMQDSLQFGKHITLVNMPSLYGQDGKKISEIERVQENLNPYAGRISPVNFINWHYGDDDKLDMAKIKYQSEVLNGHTVEIVDKIDLWTRQSVTTYTKEKNQDGKETWASGKPLFYELGEIPIIIGSDVNTLPYLENLAELNMLHFKKSSDKDNNIHMSLTPFLKFTGFKSDNMKTIISVHKAYVTENTVANIEWVELSGEGVNVAIDDIKHLESRMNAKGQDLIKDGTTTKTATEKRIDNDDNMSILQSLTIDCESTAEKILYFMSKWLGDEYPELTCEIFKDFNLRDQAIEELKLLQKDYINNAITIETYLNELVIRKLIKAKDFDIDLEIEKIEEIKNQALGLEFNTEEVEE